ncbi:hypothetical protein M5K25_011177 [Dendrobium thyrsiflorum]|uniref:Uncharacterized protein n=1 Tax=Dendrobium thyrsiflorum TaxID=117978 RepID=A0ABD0V2I6_DENTH
MSVKRDATTISTTRSPLDICSCQMNPCLGDACRKKSSTSARLENRRAITAIHRKNYQAVGRSTCMGAFFSESENNMGHLLRIPKDLKSGSLIFLSSSCANGTKEYSIYRPTGTWH